MSERNKVNYAEERNGSEPEAETLVEKLEKKKENNADNDTGNNDELDKLRWEMALRTKKTREVVTRLNQEVEALREEMMEQFTGIKDALERMPEDVAKALEQALAEKEKLDRHSGDTRVPKGIMAEIERWMIRTTRANLGIREPRGQEHTVNDAIGRARESVGEIWETWRENFGREMRSDIARLIKQEIRPGSVDRPAGNGKTFKSQNQK